MQASTRGSRALVAGCLLWLAALAITTRLGSASAHSEHGPAGFASPSRGVLLIGALCFLVMVTEGAMADWSGIYLRSNLDGGASAAATGFAGFSLGMALARLAGDGLARRWGAGTPALRRDGSRDSRARRHAPDRERVPRRRGVRAGGRRNRQRRAAAVQRSGPRPPAGPSLAAVFTLGYMGFIVGPPLIGFVADATSLPIALSMLCAAALTVALFGGRAAEHKIAGPGHARHDVTSGRPARSAPVGKQVSAQLEVVEPHDAHPVAVLLEQRRFRIRGDAADLELVVSLAHPVCDDVE